MCGVKQCAGIRIPLYFSTISINSYPDKSVRCVLNVMFFKCFESSFENAFISFTNGKKHKLWADPDFPFLATSVVSTSLPNNMQTLSLYIIPPSVNS